MKIGFAGLGIMGYPMAANIKKAAYSISVYNRTKEKADRFKKEHGAEVYESPAELARNSDIIITMVGDSSDVEEVILGHQGIINGAKAGLVIIDMSTISPEVTKNISKNLLKKDIHMLDAPVSGGDIGAINGTLTIMVGGQEKIFEKCLPVLQSMGKTVTLMGPNGSGQATKLTNQIICGLTLLGVSEGLMLASKSGLDLKKVIKALGGGSAQSWLLENAGPKIADRHFAPGFMMRHQQKDLLLALEAARTGKLSLPGISLVHQLNSAIEAEKGGSELGHVAIVKALEKLAGYEIQ